MANATSLDRALGKVARYLPEICFVTGVAGFGITYLVGSTDLVLRYLTAGIPLTAAPLFFRYLNRRTIDTPLDSRKIGVSLTNLVLLFALLYIVSLALLWRSDTRSVAYFVLVALMATVIFVEIFSSDTERASVKWLILAQVGALALNFLLGVQAVYELYVKSDSLAHIAWFNVISSTGHLQPEMWYYYYTPAFHLISVMLAQITNIDNYHAAAIALALADVMAILCAYLLVARLSGNPRLALLASLLLAVSRDFLHIGLTIEPQSFALTLSILIIYLIYRSRERASFRALTVFFMVFLILTHLSSTATLGILLIAFLIVERVSVAGERKEAKLGFTPIALFAAMTLAYHLYLSGILGQTLGNIYSATLEGPLKGMAAGAAIKMPWQFSLQGNIDQILYFGLALLGIFYLLSSGKGLRLGRLIEIAKAVVLLSFFYHYGPALYITVLRGPLLSDRVPYFVDVYVVLIVAVSFYLLAQLYRQRRGFIAVGAVFLILTMFSVSNNYSAAEAPIMVSVYEGKPNVVDIQEVKAGSFVAAIPNPATAVTDFYYADYLNWVAEQEIDKLLKKYRFHHPEEERTIDVDAGVEREILSDYDYFVFRQEVNEKEGGLMTAYNAASILSEDTIAKLERHDLIYTNGEVKYYKR